MKSNRITVSEPAALQSGDVASEIADYVLISVLYGEALIAAKRQRLISLGGLGFGCY